MTGVSAGAGLGEGAAGVAAPDCLGAEHFSIEALGSVEVATDQMHMIETEIHTPSVAGPPRCVERIETAAY